MDIFNTLWGWDFKETMERSIFDLVAMYSLLFILKRCCMNLKQAGITHVVIIMWL